MNHEKRAGYHKFILRRYLRAGVAGIKWNGRPISNGIGGRIHVEWVAGFEWNRWPVSNGIRTYLCVWGGTPCAHLFCPDISLDSFGAGR